MTQDNHLTFQKQKKQKLKKLKAAEGQGEVDNKILPLLSVINASDHFYTTSSCSGRIVLLELPKVGDKQHARFLGKWHHTITLQDLHDALSLQNTTTPQLMWFLMQSPIIHICADTIEQGDQLIKTALSAGFKNSGFRSIHKKIVIELHSTERLDAPLSHNGELLCTETYLSFLVKNANILYKRSNEKLSKLLQKIK